jgi:Tol biopolymer transport system component
VVFTGATTDGQVALWRVPLLGGEPTLVRNVNMAGASVSPDGNLVLGGYVEGQRQGIGVLALDSNDSPKIVPVFPRGMAWSPDGKSLTYMERRNGVDNLWSQPWPAGTPTQLTTFTSDLIFQFAWSPDGTQLVLSRGSTSTDVVLMQQGEV